MKIRQEEKEDYDKVFKLIENAFKDELYTDHKEQFLVERLRKSESFIPELSLVAEIDQEIQVLQSLIFTLQPIKVGK